MTAKGSNAAVQEPGAKDPATQGRAPTARGTARIVINPDWCKGCTICVSVCPRDVLAIDSAEWTGSHHPIIVARAERCTVCRNCELLCPDLAIEVLADEDVRGAGQ